MGVHKKNIEFSNYLKFARILPDISASNKKGPQGHKKGMEEMKMKFSVLKDIKQRRVPRENQIIFTCINPASGI